MDVSSSGGLGVSSSEDGKLWVWDADTGETRVRQGTGTLILGTNKTLWEPVKQLCIMCPSAYVCGSLQAMLDVQ